VGNDTVVPSHEYLGASGLGWDFAIAPKEDKKKGHSKVSFRAGAYLRVFSVGGHLRVYFFEDSFLF
jgi:hypothetical protein